MISTEESNNKSSVKRHPGDHHYAAVLLSLIFNFLHFCNCPEYSAIIFSTTTPGDRPNFPMKTFLRQINLTLISQQEFKHGPFAGRDTVEKVFLGTPFHCNNYIRRYGVRERKPIRWRALRSVFLEQKRPGPVQNICRAFI